MVKSDNVLKPGGPDAFYNYEAVGEFTDNGLAAQINNPLNWLPENTYAAPPVILRYDAQGHPITPTTFLPTTNPAGFIVQPPLALTTIAAARELVGEHCISAIRVRVAGVVTPNQESWKHIQQVAQEIRLQTGLQTVVTLGSSPQPTLVYVPGVHQGEYGAAQDIAPIGWVEERWIHIGVGLIYLTQLGQTRLLLLSAVLAVCLQLTRAPLRARRLGWLLLGLVGLQGMIGYSQYFSGLPAGLVWVHVTGSVLIWIVALRLMFATRDRGPAIPATATPAVAGSTASGQPSPAARG